MRIATNRNVFWKMDLSNVFTSEWDIPKDNNTTFERNDVEDIYHTIHK